MNQKSNLDSHINNTQLVFSAMLLSYKADRFLPLVWHLTNALSLAALKLLPNLVASSAISANATDLKI